MPTDSSPSPLTFLDSLMDCIRTQFPKDVPLSYEVWNAFSSPLKTCEPIPPTIEAVSISDPESVPSEPPKDEVVSPLGDCTLSWNELESAISGCTLCKLSKERKHPVLERGSRNAKVLFVGEAPNKIDEAQGAPFSDEAGALLDKMIAAMNLSEEDYYITQVVKCRPHLNRAPTLDEAEKCTYYLLRQIELVNPQVIVLLGRTAAQHLIRDRLIPRDISALLGKWFTVLNRPAILLTSPAYILSLADPKRQLDEKRRTWIGLQEVMKRLDI